MAGSVEYRFEAGFVVCGKALKVSGECALKLLLLFIVKVKG
jgi:hypothetical protein